MPSLTNAKQIAQIALFFSLPILSMLGTQTLTLGEPSAVLSALILLLAAVPILVAFDIIPEKFYALAIVTAAVALLYSTSLSATYLRGADIHQEYYFANLVETRSLWNLSLPHSYNTVLSVVMLAPMISILSGVPLIWVFKALYPLLFSLVPLILYRVFKRQTDAKIAFIAVFFFISIFTFYVEMVGLARQEIGEIFVALLLLLIVDKVNIAGAAKSALLILFGVSIVFSHYALACIFIGLAIIALFLRVFRGRLHLEEGYLRKKLKLGRRPQKSNDAKRGILRNHRVVTFLFIVFCSTFTVSWFMYVGNSIVLNNVERILNQIWTYISKGFLNPEVAQGVFILSSAQKTILHDVTKMLHIFTQLLISIGILAVILGESQSKFDREYVYFSVAAFLLLVGAIAFPFLASALNTTRLYHVALLFLAPFCIVGIIVSLKKLAKIASVASKRKTSISTATSLRIFAIFICIFVLFNTGFVYSLTNKDKSIADPNWALEYGSAKDRLEFYNSYVPAEEIASAKWLGENRKPSLTIYSDSERSLSPFGMISPDEILEVSKGSSEEKLVNGSYIYLRKLNVLDGLMAGWTTPQGVIVILDATSLLLWLSENANMIYSSGGSEVYYSTHALP